MSGRNILFVAGVAGVLWLTWEGNGGAATRAVPVGAFDRITSNGIADVEVRTGAAASVEVRGPQKEIDRLRIAASGGELVIGNESGRWWRRVHWGWGDSERTIVTVTLPVLHAVAVHGPGDMTIDRVRSPSFRLVSDGPGDIEIGMIETGDADLALSGPGDLTIAGHAGRARIRLRGPGDVSAEGLTVDEAVIDVAGPGDVDLAATRTADIHLSGPGDVTVTGHPRCTVNRTGPGDVTCG